MKAPLSPPRRPAAGDPAHRPAGPAASGGNHPRARAARPGPPLAAGRGPDAVRHGHLLPGLRRWRAAVGLAVRRLGPATGAAGRPVHRPGGHPVRRLGARIRGAAGRALRPGAGTGNLLHHHADHAARPPAGRGTDPLLHHAGRRAVLVAGAGAAGGPAAGGPGGLSRRAGWHRGAGRPAAGSRMGPGRRNTDGAGGAPAHAPAGGPHAARRRTAMHGHAGGRPEPAGLLVLCCRPLHDGAAAVAGVRLDRHGRGAGRHPRRAMEPAPAGLARPRAAGGAGPALRGGRRGGAGIGNLARAHARRLVGRGRAAHLRRLRPGHPQPAGTGAATLRRLPGPGRRAVQPGLLQPAGAAAGGDVVAAFRLARAAGAGLGGVALALAGLHRLRGRLS